MIESLGIKKAATRSATAAATALAATTIISAAIIGVVNPKNESANRLGVYASLAAAGCGAILGLLLKPKVRGTESPKTLDREQKADSGGTVWKDWRNFVVTRKVRESEEITSFYLKPEDGGELSTFLPGQFLTIKLDLPGQARPIIRTYSLSDYTASNEYYRLSIKREPMPKGWNVPAGLASNFMHDQVEEGTVILVKPPNGMFFVNVYQTSPVVLISNGVGITPMISMAKACSLHNPNRPIWFIHGARDGTSHAFREEVLAIAQQNPNLHVHFRYSRPRSEDESFHSTGYVDAALVKQLAESGHMDAEYFLCGSPPFLQSLTEGLKEWGIPQERIFYESFGPGRMVAAASETTEKNGTLLKAEIVFAKSGRTLTWQPNDGTILEFAEASAIDPPYSCRVGVCLTCMCRIEEGEVAYETPPTGTPDEGSVLICISKPKASRIILDL